MPSQKVPSPILKVAIKNFYAYNVHDFALERLFSIWA